MDISTEISQLSGLLGLIVIILIATIFLQYYKTRWPVRNFPPGPTGLPVFGTLLSNVSEKHFHLIASKLTQQYGNVCSFMSGKSHNNSVISTRTIHIFRYAILKGYCTSYLKLTCFVCFLKIINTFWENNICTSKQKCHWNFSRLSLPNNWPSAF